MIDKHGGHGNCGTVNGNVHVSDLDKAVGPGDKCVCMSNKP